MTVHSGSPFDSVVARRAFLARDARLRALSECDRDLVRLGQMPGRERWLEQIAATGGCAHPVYLAGGSQTFDRVTGELVRRYSTRDEPGGRLAVRCRNRRATRCEPCSRLYQGDAWQVVRSGLVGGKGVPGAVARRPMVFATLTAPSFGAVHRAGVCHRYRRASCEHGRSLGCGGQHTETDPVVGQPLCAGCYDYTGHVLWNAHAGALWKAFTDNLYHHVARHAGVGRSEVRRLVRVSAAKVAEYQRRGLVHFHAVLRFDGPSGPGEAPPGWASAGLLGQVVRSAALAVALRVPESAAVGARRLGFGTQLDVHAITSTGDQGAVDEKVAAYLAKYTTKGVDGAGSVDRPIRGAEQIASLSVTGHVRALIGTCWRLGGLVELAGLRLRAVAHQLGYRGHCLTKTRVFSTTFKSLRAERQAWVRVAKGLAPAGVDEVTVSTWWFAGSGHTVAEAEIAAGMAAERKRARDLARHYLIPGWVGGARRGSGGAERPRQAGADHGT
ncbi:replication initiator [Streptomyces tateyamensis]|uniref:replication initiator n=1 Tax=Streptomyces tateyamensis TaxID=565073 RepID=UPI001FE93147|nr:replication initiator [Streptomyces tateyamensis]